MPEIKKILLIGNFTCSNRGDLAILHGLYDSLKGKSENFEISIATTFPEIGERIFTLPFIKDEVSVFFECPVSFIERMNYSYLDKPRLMKWVSALHQGKTNIPGRFKKTAAFINGFDAVIHVGGSYFIDHYGPLKFISLALGQALGKPRFMAGHSVGPFDGNADVLKLAASLLPKVNQIHIRDTASLEHLPGIGMSEKDIMLSSDTAWLLPDFEERTFPELEGISKPMIAITARQLKSFGDRLGISQETYEESFAKLLDEYIEEGYHIVGVSMATPMGIKGYVDDRETAASIQGRLKNPEGMTVLREEYSHLEIGNILSRCKLLIGTRLHSVIIGMRYGTPAVALYYEHKSKGTMDKMGLSEHSFMLNELDGSRIRDFIKGILIQPDEAKRKILAGVKEEQRIAEEMVQMIAKEIQEG